MSLFSDVKKKLLCSSPSSRKINFRAKEKFSLRHSLLIFRPNSRRILYEKTRRAISASLTNYVKHRSLWSTEQFIFSLNYKLTDWKCLWRGLGLKGFWPRYVCHNVLYCLSIYILRSPFHMRFPAGTLNDCQIIRLIRAILAPIYITF